MTIRKSMRSSCSRRCSICGAAFGLVADTWEVILEPDRTRSWSGRQIGEAIVAAARRLRANGFATTFVAPSCANAAKSVEYFDALSKVPGAVEQLAEISYHRYAGVSEDSLRLLASRSEGSRRGTAMLEKIGASYQELHADLKIANALELAAVHVGLPRKRQRGAIFHDLFRRRQDRDAARYTDPISGAVPCPCQAGSPPGRCFQRLTTVRPIGIPEYRWRSGCCYQGGRSWDIRGAWTAGWPIPGFIYDGDDRQRRSKRRRIRSGEPYRTSIPAAGVLTIAPAPEASATAAIRS